MFDSEDGPSGFTDDYKPSYVLVALDVHPRMFQSREDNTTSFKICLESCHEVANSLIFEKSRRKWSNFAVCSVTDDATPIVSFDTNVLETIKTLKAKSKLSSEELRKLYERQSSVDLGLFFIQCKKRLKEVSTVFYRKTFILITDDDNPVADKQMRFKALNEAAHFQTQEINFELLTLNPDFGYEKFFNEFFSVMNAPPLDYFVEDSIGLTAKLSDTIVNPFYKRKLRFYPFRDDQTRCIQMTQKSYVRDFEKTFYKDSYVSVGGKRVEKRLTGQDDTERSYQLKFRSGAVNLTETELLAIKQVDLPIGYTLLSFTERQTEIGVMSHKPVILEVDNAQDVQLFESFWQVCVNRNKVLVCIAIMRTNDKINYVELIPKYANKSKVFLVVAIPPINKFDYPERQVAKREIDVDKADIINFMIERLTLHYHPSMFECPVVAKKKAFFRAKLLEEEEEEVIDRTLVSEEVNRRLGDLSEGLKDFFISEVIDNKRKSKSAPSASRKRVK